MSETYKYDAFISYRHTKLDKEVAKRLHKLLETYKAPKESGLEKRKLERVFRDQDELPTSSDLASNIYEALEASRYLIVICSPNTPHSKWVQEEIKTFIQLHGEDRVLALLIEGEPQEAFPEPLRLRVRDGVTYEVEPLAADIRAGSKHKRYRLLQKEVLRLLAPLLNCSYDTLRQRDKERQLKRMIGVGAVVIGGLTVFGGTAVWQNTLLKEQTNATRLAKDQLQKAMESILRTESLRMGDDAREVMEEGDLLMASYLALQSLPKDMMHPDRPYVPESEYILHQALKAYSTSDALIPSQVFKHEARIIHMEMTTDGRYLLTQDSQGTMTLWDRITYQSVWKKDLEDCFAIRPMCYLASDDIIVYVKGNTVVCETLVDEELIWEQSLEAIPQHLILSQDKMKIVVQNDWTYVLDVRKGTVLLAKEVFAEEEGQIIGEVVLSPDAKKVAISTIEGEVAIVPLDGQEETKRWMLPTETLGKLSFNADSTKLLCTVQKDKEHNLLEAEGYAWVYDLAGEVCFQKTIDQWGYTVGRFSPVNPELLLLVSGPVMEVIHSETGERVNTYISGGDIKDVYWKEDVVVTASDDGTIRFYMVGNTEEFTRQRLTATKPLKALRFVNGRFYAVQGDGDEVLVFDAIRDQDYTTIGKTELTQGSMYGFRGGLSKSGKWGVTYMEDQPGLELWDVQQRTKLIVPKEVEDATRTSITWGQFLGESFYFLTEEAKLYQLDCEDRRLEIKGLNFIPERVYFYKTTGQLLISCDTTYAIIDLGTLQVVKEDTLDVYIQEAVIAGGKVYIQDAKGLRPATDGGALVLAEDVEKLYGVPSSNRVLAINEKEVSVFEDTKKVFVYEAERYAIKSAVLTPGGDKFIIWYNKDQMELVDISTGKVIMLGAATPREVIGCEENQVDNALLVYDASGNVVKIEPNTYKVVATMEKVLGMNEAGTLVLMNNQEMRKTNEIIVYPYYTTQMLIDKGMDYLEDKAIDPLKKRMYHVGD